MRASSRRRPSSGARAGDGRDKHGEMKAFQARCRNILAIQRRATKSLLRRGGGASHRPAARGNGTWREDKRVALGQRRRFLSPKSK